jgi:hypothetical protein
MGIKTLDDFVSYANSLSYPTIEVSEKVSKRGKEVLDTICEMMDDNGWHYQKKEEDGEFSVAIGFDTEDYDINLHFFVDLQTQKITLLSMLPFSIKEESVDACAIAACELNYSMKDGDFLYDFTHNSLFFKLTTSFKGSLLSKSLISSFMDLAYAILDIYNDRFAALNDGEISLSDFINRIGEK